MKIIGIEGLFSEKLIFFEAYKSHVAPITFCCGASNIFEGIFKNHDFFFAQIVIKIMYLFYTFDLCSKPYLGNCPIWQL